MSGTTWTKFYWSDWESDPALRLCSLAAQGLWMRMLCIASAHDPIGYVAVAGRGLDETALARMTGCSGSEVADLLGELDRNGVFSRDRNGRIFSRRMVNDAKRAAISRKNGQKGGNPSLSKDTRNAAWDNPQDNPGVKTQKPDTKYQKDISEAKASSVAGDDVTVAFDEWNALAKRLDLPQAKALTPQRRKAIRTRLAQDGIDGWRDALSGVEASPHCRGENDRHWKADLDFVCQPKSYQRLRERFYGGETVAQVGPTVTFDGPPAVRQSIVAAKDEAFAFRWLDAYCRWDGPSRSLIVANAFAHRTIAGELSAWAAKNNVTITATPSQKEAA